MLPCHEFCIYGLVGFANVAGCWDLTSADTRIWSSLISVPKWKTLVTYIPKLSVWFFLPESNHNSDLKLFDMLFENMHYNLRECFATYILNPKCTNFSERLVSLYFKTHNNLFFYNCFDISQFRVKLVYYYWSLFWLMNFLLVSVFIPHKL